MTRAVTIPCRAVTNAAACPGLRGTIAAAIVSALLPLATAAAPLVVPGVEQRIAEARQRGYWVIQEGESLYRISRHFAGDEAETRRLVKDFQDANPNALILGDPSRLVVGARLRLPERIASTPQAGAAPPASGGLSGAAVTAPPLAPQAPVETRVAPESPPTAPPPSPIPTPVTSTTAKPAAAAPYVDRVLDSSPDAAAEDAKAAREGGEPSGLRTWAIESRNERRTSSAPGSRTDTNAIALRHTRETEQYGDFTLVGQAVRFDAQTPPQGGRSKDLDLTLYQDQFALTSQYVASSGLGVLRPTLPAWLSTSYRVALAPALLQGVSTVVTGAGGDFRASAGQLGRYAGFGIQQFVRTSGEVASMSASQRLDREWQVGAVAIGVRGSGIVEDHTSASVAVQREFGAPGSNAKLQLASSDNGERAGWFDALVRDGRLLQRFGAYQIDPNFLFGESVTVRDSRGTYWRGDYRAGGNFYGGGIEYVEDNLKRDPRRGGAETAGAFGNVVLRLDRNTQLGVGGSFRQETPRVAGGADRDVVQGNASVTRTLPVGQTRLDWNAVLTRPAGRASERTQAVNWNHDWPRLGPVSIGTLLGQSREQLVDRDVTRRTAGITARGDLGRALRWDAAFTFVDTKDTQGGDRNYNSSVTMEWSPAADWFVNLMWYRNRIQPGPDNPLAPFLQDNAVQLNVRYEVGTGTPYPRTGDAAGRSGTGTVAGSVFFDENRDGIRQGNERGAGGVIVILDERASATTDPEGRFSFPLVPAGRHRLRIVIERLPLPWGLDDESPREVEVRVREESRLDIGLARIGP